MDDESSLGKCCICEAENRSVRNLITLHKKIPDGEKGGWGCFTCGSPSRGAVAVLCDDCLDKTMADETIEIKFACLGYPGENRRIEIKELTEDFDHDMSKHPEENQMNFLSVEHNQPIIFACPKCGSLNVDDDDEPFICDDCDHEWWLDDE